MPASPAVYGVAIPDKYQEILQIVGDLQVAVNNAIRRYVHFVHRRLRLTVRFAHRRHFVWHKGCLTALDIASEQIEKCEKEITHFQNKYVHFVHQRLRLMGCSYETFFEGITNGNNPEFLENLNHRHPTWEADFNVWETYVEELQRWRNRVTKLLTD